MHIHRSNILLPIVLLLMLLLLAACSIGGSNTSSQPTPRPSPTPNQGAQLLARVGNSFNTAKTLHAVLNISITGSGFNGTVQTEVWNQSPNKDRTVVLQSTLAQFPTGEISVSNGQQIWEYIPSKKVVYTGQVSASSGNTSQDTSQFLLGLVRTVFTGSNATLVSSTASIDARVAYDVHVTQNVQVNSTNGSRFNYEGDVYIDTATYQLLRVVLNVQGFGQATINFSTLEYNAQLDQSLFTFTPPAGVTVAPFPTQSPDTGALTLAQAQQQAGYHLLSIPSSQTAYALQTVDALGAPGNQIYTLNYLYNGGSAFTISEGKALANLPTSGQQVKVRSTTGTLGTVGGATTLSWTENGVGIQVAGSISSQQALAIAGLLA